MPISGNLHPYWYVWGAMIQRCTNPNNPSYPNYGGRGITVCERWRKMENFESDMGPRPFPGASLERIDNNKGYSPENCKWATSKEQACNKRIVVGESTHKGVVRNKKSWSCKYYDPIAEEMFHLGTYPTADKAAHVRKEFIELYNKDKTAAISWIKKPRIRNDSKTGITGITVSKNGKFHAYTSANGGRRTNIGYFNTLQEAIDARSQFIANRT